MRCRSAIGGKMGHSICVRLACVSAAALLSGLGAADQANAGGFAVREQSSYFQGSGFAGTAAGGDISSMFWNSAAITTVPGFNAEASGTIIFPSSDVTATGGILALADPYRTTNIGVDTFVPAMYGSYQLNDRLYAGIAVNSPFGFATKPDNSLWAGAPIALTSQVRTLDFNPTLAYRITPELSIGVGAQAEYMRVRLNSLSQSLDADLWGAGATAGILWQPSPATSIGLGYRSAITQDLSGLVIQPPCGIRGKRKRHAPGRGDLERPSGPHGPLNAAWHGRVAESKAASGIYPLRAALSAAPAECAKPSTSITMTNGILH